MQSDTLLIQNQILLRVMLQLKSENENNLIHLQQLLQYQSKIEVEAQEKRDKQMKRKSRNGALLATHLKENLPGIT